MKKEVIMCRNTRTYKNSCNDLFTPFGMLVEPKQDLEDFLKRKMQSETRTYNNNIKNALSKHNRYIRFFTKHSISKQIKLRRARDWPPKIF